MGIFSFFKSGNYFDKNIAPKCDYCRYGKRAKDGNKVLCEQRGLVDAAYSCGKFIYSPLKRIPVKQLNFVGSLADEDLYSESANERAQKEALIKAEEEAAKAERLSKEAAQHMEAKEKAEKERAEKEAAAKAEAEKAEAEKAAAEKAAADEKAKAEVEAKSNDAENAQEVKPAEVKKAPAAAPVAPAVQSAPDAQKVQNAQQAPNTQQVQNVQLAPNAVPNVQPANVAPVPKAAPAPGKPVAPVQENK